MEGFAAWLKQLELAPVIDTVLIVAASLLCITLHEVCHGLAAYWMGDPTAKRMGRLTLNPVRHIDMVGLIMMAVLKFGWAKPVPVDMRKFQNPKLGMAVTAAAGPLANVLLAFLAALLYAVTLFLSLKFPRQDIWQYCNLFLQYTAILSAGLAVFNVFPIPPLDGSKILLALAPKRVYLMALRYEHYGMILLTVLLLLNLLDKPLFFLRDHLLQGMNVLAAPVFQYLVEHFL